MQRTGSRSRRGTAQPTIGLRFLTDFLHGDVYFRVHRPQHNLDRCRTQFRLVESIAWQEEAMQKLVVYQFEIFRLALAPALFVSAFESMSKTKSKNRRALKMIHYPICREQDALHTGSADATSPGW